MCPVGRARLGDTVSNSRSQRVLAHAQARQVNVWSPEYGTLMLLVVLMTQPLFIVTTPDGVAFAPFLAFEPGRTAHGFGVPIAIVAVALLAAVWLRRLLRGELVEPPSARLAGIIVGFVGWMSVVGAYGVFSAAQPVTTTALFIQTVLPPFVLLMVVTIPLDRSMYRRILLAIPVAGTVAALLLMVAAGVFFRESEPVVAFARLAEAFYGVKNVHPVVVSVGLAVLLAEVASNDDRRFPSAALWFMLVVHSAYLLINWSRSGLLMIAVIFGLWFARQGWRVLRGQPVRTRFSWECGAVAVLVTTFGFLSVTVAGIGFRPVPEGLRAVASASTNPALSETSSGAEASIDTPGRGGARRPEPLQGVWSEPRNEGSDRGARVVQDQEFADTRRVLLLLGSIARIAQSPLVGDAFNPLPPDSVVYGRTLRDHKIYPAHNQYFDLAIRMGIPGAILFMLLVGTLLVVTLKGTASMDSGTFAKEIAFAAAATLFAAAAASMFQAYFVVTQSGVLLFLFAGLASRLAVRSDNYGSMTAQ